MKATEELIQEHTVILHMLGGVTKLAQTIQTTGEVDVKKVEKIIDFSRHFTDGCHHAKEEKHLFVRLQQHGMSSNYGPVAVMLHEHQLGRNLIKEAENALQDYQSGKKEAVGVLSQALLKYVELLRAHIDKENNVLFPMSDNILTPDDQKYLEESFRSIEEHDVGAGVHEKYHTIAHEIAG